MRVGRGETMASVVYDLAPIITIGALSLTPLATCIIVVMGLLERGKKKPLYSAVNGNGYRSGFLLYGLLYMGLAVIGSYKYGCYWAVAPIGRYSRPPIAKERCLANKCVKGSGICT